MPDFPIAIPAVSAIGLPAVGSVNPAVESTGTGSVAATGGASFADVLANQVDQLQGLQSTADAAARKAATGDITDVHDYMIASTEAALATDMVVTIRNKAVEAFNEIMRMPV